MKPILLLSVLILSACTIQGDYCDVKRPLIINEPGSSALAQADPDASKQIIAENLYGIEHCEPEWSKPFDIAEEEG